MFKMFQGHTSVGALGDSFYEYLIKEWLQNRTDTQAKEMYDEAIDVSSTVFIKV